ncbi:GPO family capsid scaffolding protein [Rubrivivax gelatinosus]|uniref:Capsid scaffolding serine peptidase GPO n=1 Tax=Rubrivivax gelatinosus TaxID=28068 RepID=A0A4R2MFL7_RUBGE|nr:GPO family capsid scaffolding protein [Rubrivivax gelatinosus]MBK1686187.1 hypothetical protein [Rubrivivax gelatinosus]TCP05682.1 capsid scaffolding serine peptidase GPO [Rubrivivax gelatinosus]
MAQKSKWFRVATEGATTDGRRIERSWIEQMAANFDPKRYGARVWLEHFRGIYPDSAFRAYGDVVGLKAEKVEDGKLGLFAQIAPLPELVDMVGKGQKIYTSIEVNPKFADTGEAYLTGLAVTDSPASLGTEVLAFAQQHPDANPFTKRKSHADALFTAAVEASLQFEDVADEDTGVQRFAAQLRSLVDRFKSRAKGDDARFGEVVTALGDMSEAFEAALDDQAEQFKAAGDRLKKLEDQVVKLSADLKAAQDTLAKVDKTENHSTQRPPATGGPGQVVTDC